MINTSRKTRKQVEDGAKQLLELVHPPLDQIPRRWDYSRVVVCETNSWQTRWKRNDESLNNSFRRLMSLMHTIFTASGYIASVITPRCDVTYSTISSNAPRLTSFHLRSLSGSATKSNKTQHCWIFWTNSSSLSAGAASERINIIG